MIDVERARLDPTSVFQLPQDVVCAEELSHQQKVDILQRWKYDAIELEIAEEENMPGSDEDLLDAIMVALKQLDE